MLQDVDLIVPWLAISTSGQYLLVILLITYACATWLPQRDNAYLINFVFTTFIATIPPSLLLYSGHLYSPVPSRLCMAQASLVMGVVPMFAIAQLALVFDTWSELRSLCAHKRHISRMPFVKCIALIAPYFAFGFWTFATFQATLVSKLNVPGQVHTVRYVYCRANGQLWAHLNSITGLFVLFVTVVQVFFEVWVAWMIYAYPSRVKDDPTTWRTNIQFSLRVLILSVLQLLTVFLDVLNGSLALQNEGVKRATELLTSMDALATFIVVGAQTNVLLAWKYAFLRLWDTITCKTPEDPDELQPQGYPVLDWAHVPRNYFEPSRGSGGDGPRFGSVNADLEGGNVGEMHESGVGESKMGYYPKFLSRLKLGR